MAPLVLGPTVLVLERERQRERKTKRETENKLIERERDLTSLNGTFGSWAHGI
jgi:hypothetical protein